MREMANLIYQLRYTDNDGECQSAVVTARSPDMAWSILEARLREDGLRIGKRLPISGIKSNGEGKVLYDSQIEAYTDCAQEGLMARNNNP